MAYRARRKSSAGYRSARRGSVRRGSVRRTGRRSSSGRGRGLNTLRIVVEQQPPRVGSIDGVVPGLNGKLEPVRSGRSRF